MYEHFQVQVRYILARIAGAIRVKVDELTLSDKMKIQILNELNDRLFLEDVLLIDKKQDSIPLKVGDFKWVFDLVDLGFKERF
jgi:ribosomal protein S8